MEVPAGLEGPRGEGLKGSGRLRPDGHAQARILQPSLIQGQDVLNSPKRGVWAAAEGVFGKRCQSRTEFRGVPFALSLWWLFAVSSEKWSDTEPVREKVRPHIFTTARKWLQAPLCRSFLWELVKVWAHPTSNHPLRALGRVSF